MNDAIVSVKNLSFSYKGKDKSDDYTIFLPQLKLAPKSVLAITGVSGCGKSTLLECLGLLRDGYDADSYKLDNKDIMKLTYKEQLKLRAAMFGFMPQTGGLIPYLSIKDNLKVQIEVASDARNKLTHQKVNKKDLFEKSYENLKTFGLSDYLDRYPHELSIGQRQRAVFFKTLCHAPRVVLIDEPTSSLDPEHGQMLFSNIVTVCSSQNMCALVVTHDLDLVKTNNLSSLEYQKMDGNTGEFVLKD